MNSKRLVAASLSAVLSAMSVSSSIVASADDPQLETTNLRVVQGATTTISWDINPLATSYAVERTEIGPCYQAMDMKRCLATGLPTPQAEDPESPLPGHMFFYVSTGQAPGSGPWDIVRGSGICGPRVYVDPDALGSETGVSWADAYTSLSDAVEGYRAGSTSNQNPQIWIHGSPVGVLDVWSAVPESFALIGGFAGSEAQRWERPNDGSRSGIEGVDGRTLERLTLDRVRVSGDVEFRCSEPICMNRLYFVDSDFEGSGLDLSGRWGSYGHRARMRGVTIPSGVLDYGLDEVSRAAAWISDVEISAPSGAAALDIYAFSSVDGGELDLVLERTVLLGGANGLKILAATTSDVPARVDAEIHDVVIAAASGNGIDARAEVWVPSFAPPFGTTLVDLTLDNVTIADNGGHGVALFAPGEGLLPDGYEDGRARLTLWNSALTGNGGYGVHEALPDFPETAYGREFVGNDFFLDASGVYLKIGMEHYGTTIDLNQLSYAYANFSLHPFYVDAAAGNYHIDSSSPLVDRATPGGPIGSRLDVDRDRRPQDGDLDGIEVRDVGADETVPM